jgi:hypothetical protein
VRAPTPILTSFGYRLGSFSRNLDYPSFDLDRHTCFTRAVYDGGHPFSTIALASQSFTPLSSPLLPLPVCGFGEKNGKIN